MAALAYFEPTTVPVLRPNNLRDIRVNINIDAEIARDNVIRQVSRDIYKDAFKIRR